MSCQQTASYYSKNSDVYHKCKNCVLGHNIESDTRESGNPGLRRLCKHCKQIMAGEVTR